MLDSNIQITAPFALWILGTKRAGIKNRTSDFHHKLLPEPNGRVEAMHSPVDDLPWSNVAAMNVATLDKT